MLWLCFKLPICLFGHTRDTSVNLEKSKVIDFINMQPRKNKILICSNKHEKGLVSCFTVYNYHCYMSWFN